MDVARRSRLRWFGYVERTDKANWVPACTSSKRRTLEQGVDRLRDEFVKMYFGRNDKVLCPSVRNRCQKGNDDVRVDERSGGHLMRNLQVYILTFYASMGRIYT